ncbi:hypothetical protein NKG94_32650 [Micromonospora sp. M12]
METYLSRLGGFGAVTVDGKQSAADCAAIKSSRRGTTFAPSRVAPDRPRSTWPSASPPPTRPVARPARAPHSAWT